MKLFIFRHGETDSNKLGILQGITDNVLNATGIKQAEVLRDKLAPEKLPLIYSSPLKRAHKTAEIVASANGSEIVVVKDLHEIMLGEFEGMEKSKFYEKFGGFFQNHSSPEDKEFMTAKIPGGESRGELKARWERALAEIKKDCSFEKVGVATHGGFMSVIYFLYFNELRSAFENCECFTIEI